MLFDKEVTTEVGLELSQPTWYARRTIVDSMENFVDGEVLDLSKTPLSFKQGDHVMVVGLDEEFHPTGEAVFLTVLEKDGSLYTLSDTVEITGHAIIMKAYKHSVQIDAKEWAIIPVSRTMILADQASEDHTLLKMGIKTPGWYHWMWYEMSDGAIRVKAELLVGMKEFCGEPFADINGIETSNTHLDTTIVDEDAVIILS